jgi:hypothetical protein
MNTTHYTEKENELIRKYYSDYPTDKLLKLLPGRTLESIYSRAYKLGLRKSEAYYAKYKGGRMQTGTTRGRKTWFKKGSVPYNKGTVGLTRSNPGSYKKGNVPHNKLPIGTVLEKYHKRDDRWYWYIKTDHPKRKWRLLSRELWQRKFGPLRRDEVLLNISGDTMDANPFNFVKITRKQLVKLNQNPEKISKTLREINSGKRKPKPVSTGMALRKLCGQDKEMKEYIKNNRPDLIQVAKKTIKLQRNIRYGSND